jgi:hypothetical protein
MREVNIRFDLSILLGNFCFHGKGTVSIYSVNAKLGQIFKLTLGMVIEYLLMADDPVRSSIRTNFELRPLREHYPLSRVLHVCATVVVEVKVVPLEDS